MNDLYAGLKADYDLSDHGDNDAIAFFSVGNFPYIFIDGIYAAVTSLMQDETGYAIWKRGEDPLRDSDRYNLLISPTPNEPPIGLGDYRILSKIALPELSSGDSTVVSFILATGENQGKLNSNIRRLKNKMNPEMLPRIVSPDNEVEKDSSQTNYYSFYFGANPNPFNPNVKIQFYLPDISKVRIKIFDLLGREIVELVNMEYPAGNHSVMWDGITYQGRKASTGIYFANIETEKETGTIKLLMVR